MQDRIITNRVYNIRVVESYNEIYFETRIFIQQKSCSQMYNMNQIFSSSCGIRYAIEIKYSRKKQIHIKAYISHKPPRLQTESVRCATCGEDLPTLEALKDHRRTAHPTPEVAPGSGKKGFECDYCGKTFNCRSNLRDHLVSCKEVFVGVPFH